jgi:hypothetical protein
MFPMKYAHLSIYSHSIVGVMAEHNQYLASAYLYIQVYMSSTNRVPHKSRFIHFIQLLGRLLYVL